MTETMSDIERRLTAALRVVRKHAWAARRNKRDADQILRQIIITVDYAIGTESDKPKGAKLNDEQDTELR